MKRIIGSFLLLALLGVLLGCPAALGDVEKGERVTVYSRSITLKVDAEPAEEGDLYIIYSPGLGSGTEVRDPDDAAKGYKSGSKIAVKGCPSDFKGPVVEDKEWVFAGWSTTKNAKKAEAKYAPGQAVTLTKPLTLYAVWLKEKKTAKVTYHAGSVSGKNVTLEYEDGVMTTLPDPTADSSFSAWKTSGKKFVGWQIEKHGDQIFKAGASVVITDSNHAYAVWGKNKDGKNISIDKYITNRQWDKYGEEKLFKAGDKVSFNIDVINTGTEDIGKIVVYDVLKGAKIKKGSGYKVDSDGDAIIKDLAPGELVRVHATYTVKRSDQYKSKVANTAYAYYGKGEKSDSVRIPIKRLYASDVTADTTPSSSITVYADESMKTALERIRYYYEAANPNADVAIVYGDASELAQRVASGAYGDLFIAEGEEMMNTLDATADAYDNPQRTDRIVSTTRADVTENRAALIVPRNTTGSMSFRTLDTELRTCRKLAISGTQESGLFARQILAALGADTEALTESGSIVICDTDQEVMAAVQTGTADAGVILGADAAAAGLTVADKADSTLCGRVLYPAAVMKSSVSRSAAESFLYYLRGQDARLIFESLGYTAAGSK